MIERYEEDGSGGVIASLSSRGVFIRRAILWVLLLSPSDDFYHPSPEWSAFRTGAVYGAGRLVIQNPSEALWEWTVRARERRNRHGFTSTLLSTIALLCSFEEPVPAGVNRRPPRGHGMAAVVTRCAFATLSLPPKIFRTLCRRTRLMYEKERVNRRDVTTPVRFTSSSGEHGVDCPPRQTYPEQQHR